MDNLSKQTLIGIGIAELLVMVIVIIGAIILIKNSYVKQRDSRLFNQIKDNSFEFTSKRFYENRHILKSYIDAYVTYGYNVKCNMTEQEFRVRLLRFIGCFSRTDIDRTKSLNIMLDQVSTALRKRSKCGDESCGLRARYLMKKIEEEYSEEINNGDEDITEFIREVHLLMSAFDSEE